MQLSLETRNPNHGNEYSLRQESGLWRLTFEGRPASFKHELGALYVACLLLDPPLEPFHAVALALKARGRADRTGPAWDPEEIEMGLADAAAVRALWRKQGELERLLADRSEIEPVKAEAQRELEDITEQLRRSRWLSHQGAERCERAVARAIRRFQARLSGAVDAQGQPDEVLRAFGAHLFYRLLVPSGHAGGPNAAREAAVPPGCFIYQPPKGVFWEGSLKSEVQSLEKCGVRSAECGMGKAKENGRLKSPTHHGTGQVSPATRHGQTLHSQPSTLNSAVFLWAGVLGLLLSGCAVRALQGGKAVLTRKPGGAVEQSLVQGENPSQATRQEQENLRLRTYTVPAGSFVSEGWRVARDEGEIRNPKSETPEPKASALDGSQPSTLNSQLLLSAPMPVTEREESRTRTELGAAQKDTAREVGARLASLKGIVWVGVGLFVFGLGSLVWPPLRAVIGSVTTSAALMAGGLALMVLPSLVVGHELLMLGTVGLGVGGWFLAHRHGQLSSLRAKG